MPSPTTPILGLTLMTTSQAQKEVVFNQFAIAFDALFKGSVKDVTLIAPPGSPVAGDAYIVAASATGAWSGKDKKVAFYYNGWQFASPSLKMRLYSVAQSEFFVYESGGVWTAEPASTVSVLGDLTNVTGVPTDGQVLQFQTSDSKWHPWTVAFPSLALTALFDVTVTEGSGIDGYALVWNNGAAKWEAGPVLSAKPGVLTLPDVVTTGVADGKVVTYSSTAGPGGTPALHFIDPSTLITVSSLAQVGDVSYPIGGVGDIVTGSSLVWNGAGWVPSSDAPATIGVTGIIDGPGAMTGHAYQTIRVNSVESAWEYTDFKLANLADVNVTEGSGIDGHLLAWNNGTGKWQAVANTATALSGLSDVTVTEGSEIDGFVLAWKYADTKWEAKALSAVAVSGAYSDLTGRPSLATVATSGAYADLTGKPTLATVATSGAYADLTGAPSIPANASFNLASLGDVTMTTGSGVDGYVVYWNNGAAKFELKAAGGGTLATLTDVNVTEGSGIDGYVLKWDNGTSRWIASAGGGGSSTLAADTDVTLTSPSDGQVLTYSAGSSKWINATPSGGGGGGGGSAETPPVATALTAYTHLGGATLTQRTTDCIPSLSVVSAGSDGNIYVAMEAAPVGTFSIVTKVKVNGYGNNWHGAGVAVYNSGNSHFGSTMFNGTNIWYPLGWTSTSSFSIRSTNTTQDSDFYQHIDYDGTLLKYGLSRNGIDVYWFYTENMVSALGAITHIGIAWYGDSSYTYDFEHYHSGALGTNGLASSGGGSGTLAGDTDVTLTSPSDGQVLTYDAGTSKWINSNPTGGGGGGSGVEHYSNGSSAKLTLGSTPIPITTIDSCDVTIPPATVARTFVFDGTVAWDLPTEQMSHSRSGNGHAMRVCVTLDGTQVFPYPGDTQAGVMTGSSADGVNWTSISGISVTVPGDNATHVIALAWSSSGSTSGLDVFARSVYAVNYAATGGANVPLAIVQSALQGNSSGGAITLGAAPMAGNTLVCLATSQASMVPDTGWAQLQYNVSGMDWAAIYVKIAGSGESATQTPFTQSSSNTAQVCVYELSGADAAKSLANALSNASNDQVSATPVTSNVLTDAGGCYLVFVSGNATGTPTLSAGTIDQQNTALTAGRNVVAGHLIDNSGGARSFTTTFGGSGTTKSLIVAMQPATASLGIDTGMPYNLAAFISGVMTNSEVVLAHVAPYPVRFLAGAPNSYAKAGVATTSAASMTIKKNGASVGTIDWPSGSSGTFTVASNIDLAAGDVITFTGPATADATLADIAITLAGNRI